MNMLIHKAISFWIANRLMLRDVPKDMREWALSHKHFAWDKMDCDGNFGEHDVEDFKMCETYRLFSPFHPGDEKC